MKQVGSLVFWAFVVVTSILLFPFALLIWAVTAPFGRRRVALHRFTCFWASLYTWFNPVWDVKISGRENIEPGKTYMLVANHLSLLDILVLFRLFRDFKWVSKAEIFKVPVVGWNMSLNRYIPLKRGDRDSVVEMMENCRQTLGQGSSIMMFPEGTRSKTSEMRAFKTGAFELARQAEVPVVPIVIRGTSDALPKHGFVLQGRHHISVTVLPAVPVTEVTAMDTESLTAHTRQLIIDEQERFSAEARQGS
ncbi:MAG TPA: lysophospholipid acyltransferase family protein [Actinomycetota bacterium]|nr:lysophospholipid acyltransferase family protein [Actinomycetota bacterium]